MASFSFLSFSYQVEGREGVVEGLSGGGEWGERLRGMSDLECQKCKGLRRPFSGGDDMTF